MKFVLGSNAGSTGDYCASVVWSGFQNDIGEDALPVALIQPNAQTIFAFDSAQMPLPTIQEDLEEGSSIDLINHNAEQDSISSRSDYVIDSIVDNHALELHLKYPCEIRTAAVGSTCTLIAETFIDKVYIPEMPYLVVLLSGIIADTQNFTSDTTTERDEEAFHRLKELINSEDMETFIIDLLEKKA